MNIEKPINFSSYDIYQVSRMHRILDFDEISVIFLIQPSFIS